MGLMDFIRGELLEIIEWVDDSRDTIAWRFPDEDKAIKNGAQLIVRESQMVQLVYLGEFADTFEPGKHTLETENIPILTKLNSWTYGFDSPFKVDVYFINTRLFTGMKWGTANPIMMRDQDFGIIRARAYGTFDFRVTDPRLFLKEVAGSDHNFRVEEFAGTMRSRVISVFAQALASSNVPVLDAATRYSELGEALLPLINPAMSAKYGMEIASFVVENISLPKEVEEAMDKRSSMAAVGNLNDYVKYQVAEGLGHPGGGGGPVGMASELAMGMAVAQEMIKGRGGILGRGDGGASPPGTTGAAPPPWPELMTPEQVAQVLGVSRSDVKAIIESGELKAKKIGASHRILRPALDAYLAQ